MTEKFEQIENNPDLIRNSDNKAVINRNVAEYENYKAARRKRLSQEQRITNLENKLDKILSLLENNEK